jgi:hypothetical protein
MSFEVSWYLPKRIIHIHVLGELGLNQVTEMADAASKLLQEGDAPVHILLDDAKGGRPPISLKELQSRLELVRHPSVGWVVGIGEADPVAKFLIPLLMKIIRLDYVRVMTLEEGLHFLSKQDTSLQLTLPEN